MDCTDSIGWTDWLDEELLKLTGEFHVHRNYIGKDGQYYFIPYQRPDRNITKNRGDNMGIKYIDETPPIAEGITAYFIWDHGSKKCLKSRIVLNLDFDANSFYKFYFDYCFNIRVKENNRLPKPLPAEKLKRECLRDHLEDEKLRYIKSSKYFDQRNNEDGNRINNKLEEYVKGYLEWVENMESNNDIANVSYVLKNESVILKLFEAYGSWFPGETKEVWEKRWVDSKKTLTPIKVDSFKEGNNKHLLLSILHEAYPFMKVKRIEDYTKRRWGLYSYSSEISKYINNSLYKNNPERKRISNHPEMGKIREILKPEQI